MFGLLWQDTMTLGRITVQVRHVYIWRTISLDPDGVPVGYFEPVN